MPNFIPPLLPIKPPYMPRAHLLPASKIPLSQMEANCDKDPKVIIQRQQPYYECIFCKRGFSTAQALGGHMNVHRKGRAKSQQPAVISAAAAMPLFNSKSEEDGLDSHVQMAESSSCTTQLSLHESWLGLGDMMKVAMNQEGQISCSGRSQEVKLPCDDLELSLTLHISDPDFLDGGGFKEQELEGEALDLELRLGH